MKDWNTTKIIKFALAMTTGFIIYDVLFKDSVEWISAIATGVLTGFLVWAYTQYSTNKK